MCSGKKLKNSYNVKQQDTVIPVSVWLIIEFSGPRHNDF